MNDFQGTCLNSENGDRLSAKDFLGTSLPVELSPDEILGVLNLEHRKSLRTFDLPVKEATAIASKVSTSLLDPVSFEVDGLSYLVEPGSSVNVVYGLDSAITTITFDNIACNE